MLNGFKQGHMRPSRVTWHQMDSKRLRNIIMSNTESDGVIQSHIDTDIVLSKVTQRHREL